MSTFRNQALAATVAGLLFGIAPGAQAEMSSERRSLEEIRNTVINLLQALVEQGVMSRDKAEQLVKQAQDKATTDLEAQAQAEEGAVRVTYVPDIVKEEIRKQVVAELRPAVVMDVTERAKEEKWGVPAALPDWIGRLKWSGDLRLRARGDFFASGNAQGFYLDFLTVNDRGGIGNAGTSAFTNLTEDRQRMQARIRLGLEAQLTPTLKAAVRMSTGNLRDPVSTNQTLGNTGARYQVGFEQAYFRWEPRNAAKFPYLTMWAGRVPNPWLSTDLVYDADLSFEGIAGTYRLPFDSGDPQSSHAFLTLGAFPLEEVELSSKDKMLLGAQLGTELHFGEDQRLRIGAAYYDFRNVQGRRNVADSTLFDFTAPKFLQRGNTLFDIRNDVNVSTNLFALAGQYELLNATVAYELPLWNGLRFTATGDFVENIGWKAEDVLAVSGIDAEARTTGYQVEFGFGHPSTLKRGQWRTFLTYRYLQRDAVLDAFTDSDFRGGGTDVKGYTIGGDYGLANGTWARLRYISGDEIDGAPFGLDIVMLDLNSQF